MLQSLNVMSPLNSSTQSLGNTVKDEGESEWESEGMVDTSRTMTWKLTKKGTEEFTKTEAATQAFVGLHQVLCVCILAFIVVFLLDSWVWEQVSLWFMCLFLELFFCWLVLSNFALFSYYILVCHVQLLSLRNL